MSSPTEPTAHIEHLPPEMINELFKYLGLKDLATCSMVNKRWHSIFTAFKLHTLAAFDEDDCPYYESSGWSYPAIREVDEEERCPPAMFRRLAEKPLLSNLKRLAVFGPSSEFDLNKLNLFSQLLHLEVNILLYYNEVNTRVHLNLPKLRVLVLHYFNCRALSVDCPEISTLLYEVDEYHPPDANLLDVKHPETVRRLETGMVGAKLVPFKNVECLVTREFEAISKATLLSLPRLRELRYIRNIRYLIGNGSSDKPPITVARMKRELNEFMDEAKKLKGSDFQFRFIGFQLTKKMLDQIDFGVQVDERSGDERVYNEYVYMKNYHLIELGALQFLWDIDYTRLLSKVTGEFPCCFSQKFTGISRVEATAEVRDAGHFLWFLKSLKSLRCLVLERTGLGQEFFDQLPTAARSLTGLHLREGHCKDGLKLNFDFIGDFLRLSDLTILPIESLQSITPLVRWLGRLKKGSFLLPSKEDVGIIKKRNSTWKVVGLSPSTHL